MTSKAGTGRWCCSTMGLLGGGLDIDAIDLDGDGALDLLLNLTNTVIYWTRQIQVLMNNGDGTFRDETATRLPQTTDGVWLQFVHLHDLNYDGALDLVVKPYGGSSPLFWMNDGTGHFVGQPNVFNIETDLLFTFLDLDADGDLDVVWSLSGCEGEDCFETHFVVVAG